MKPLLQLFGAACAFAGAWILATKGTTCFDHAVAVASGFIGCLLVLDAITGRR